MLPGTSRFPSIEFMERLETYGYISVGISFLLLGMAVFVYGWWEFAEMATTHVPKAILVLLNDLLLVVILLELFRTIVNFLKTGEISLEPFLHVGIIAAVRKILTVGAEMVLAETIDEIRFTQYLFDVGVHGAVVLALVAGLYFYRTPRRTVAANVPPPQAS
ncbi:MAG: phosphate-starvation-inducible PsiE family protein [Nitrospirota bacterium]